MTKRKPTLDNVARLAKIARDRFRRDLRTLIVAAILSAMAAGAMFANVRFDHFPPAGATEEDAAIMAIITCILLVAAGAVNLIAVLKFVFDFNECLMPMLCDLAEVHRSQVDEIARSVEQSIRDEDTDTTRFEWEGFGHLGDGQTGPEPGGAPTEPDSEA